MARHLVRAFAVAGVACALTLGCTQSSSVSSNSQTARPEPARTAGGDTRTAHSALPGPTNQVAGSPDAQYRTDDVAPWLAELLQDPDPNVRVQALDALAHQPTPPLNVVTAALVDPDESVRTRAQELFEQELARR